MVKIIDKTVFFTSNRADAMTNKVNECIDDNINNVNTRIEKIEHGISYSEHRGYMMSCMIHYSDVMFKEEENDAEKSEEDNK